jgi:hypothetical protein
MLSTALDCAYQRYPRGNQNRKSKKNSQHECQKKKDKGTNNDLQNIHFKTRDRVTWTSQQTGVELRCSGRVIRGTHSWFDALTRNTFYFIIFWKLWKLKYDTNIVTTVRVLNVESWVLLCVLNVQSWLLLCVLNA